MRAVLFVAAWLHISLSGYLVSPCDDGSEGCAVHGRKTVAARGRGHPPAGRKPRGGRVRPGPPGPQKNSEVILRRSPEEGEDPGGDQGAESSSTFSVHDDFVDKLDSLKEDDFLNDSSLVNATGKSPAIACCFVGQFLRNAQMTRNIHSVFAKATSNIKFDAFVCMANQRTEMNDRDKVDGTLLCENLHRLGFRGCKASLKPYDGSVFVKATEHLGFREDAIFPVSLLLLLLFWW